ncbi:VOC family protein [Agromyces sp. SYSU T0242]|uniref:VOC family protein n=1 Tax=Agromyces litoreus TaxID=3158561 RepID=UPI003392EBE0
MPDIQMAMVTLPASDLARARTFWHDAFGVEPMDSREGADFYVMAGTVVLVYETEFAGTAKNTALSLMTEHLDRDMTELRTHGVTFHDYDLPGLRTVDGVADLDEMRTAWFTDTEGNIIAINEPTSADAREQVRAMRGGVAPA